MNNNNLLNVQDCWLATDIIAKLKGVTERAIRLAIRKDKYISKAYNARGGKSYKVLLSSLEPEIQQKYLAEYYKKMVLSEAQLEIIQTKRIKLDIKSDSYRNQCYARAYVLKNDEWSLIYSIPYSLMQTPDSLAYHNEYKNNPKLAEPKFRSDITKLKEFTAKILF